MLGVHLELRGPTESQPGNNRLRAASQDIASEFMTSRGSCGLAEEAGPLSVILEGRGPRPIFMVITSWVNVNIDLSVEFSSRVNFNRS